MKRGAYQRRDCKRITMEKQRERNRVAIDSIRGVRPATEEFFEGRDMPMPPVSRILNAFTATEPRRWVSRGKGR